MGYSKFKKLREAFMVLFQKLQGPKGLLDPVSVRIVEALIYEPPDSPYLPPPQQTGLRRVHVHCLRPSSWGHSKLCERGLVPGIGPVNLCFGDLVEPYLDHM